MVIDQDPTYTNTSCANESVIPVAGEPAYYPRYIEDEANGDDLVNWAPLTTPISTTNNMITVQVNPLLDKPVFVRVKVAED